MSTNLPQKLWKLTIDPRGKTNTDADSFQFCHDRSIIGIGWGFSRLPDSKSDADTLFRKEHKKGIKAFNVLVHRMSPKDHAWVYGKRKYYICRIDSDWEHRIGEEWDENDIHNIRSVTWKKVPTLLVPGCVKRSLTMYGTAQAIGSNRSLLQYSHWLFENKLNINQIYSTTNIANIPSKLSTKKPQYLFNIIDEDETEDVVGLYLQKKLGWYMIKSSAYKSKRDFECELQRDSGGIPETAYMQVKSGHSIPLDCKEYVKYLNPNTYIYLFSTCSSPYQNIDANKYIIPINHDDIFNFVLRNFNILPLAIMLKLSIIL